jgi:hypothetical protein
MKNFFNFWPEEMQSLPQEKRKEAMKAIFEGKKLITTISLSIVYDILVVGALIYLAIFVYGVNLERGSLESIYFVLGGLVLCALWIIPLKIVAKSEYYRVKSKLH